MRARAGSIALALGALLLATPCAARELWKQGERSLELRSTVKAGALLSRAPADTALDPERDSGASLWRIRLEAEYHASRAANVLVADEQRLRFASRDPFTTGANVLPTEAPAPYRIRQLDWSLLESGGTTWRHEIDRGSVTLHRPRGEITLGRQAIGWGRGVMFGAVDLFAPFAPLEADREWRRGVDAARADLRLTDRVSLDGVAASGRDLDQSAFAARLRGYTEKADGELVLGRRARDLVAGVTTSAPVADAEIHGELALFRADDRLPDGRRSIVKAVLGGSYRFAIGTGLPVFLEYHYSGFGVAKPGEVLPRLADPAFQERYLRGDTQILCRHALGLSAPYELSEELSFGLTGLLSPGDGSGVISPSATLRFGDRVVLLASGYVPFGARPDGATLRSFYGATPISAFLQIAVYD